MTTRSLAHNTEITQAPVERLLKLLPKKMRACEKDQYHGLAYQQHKRFAIQQSEICVNDDERIVAIVVDVDRPDASTAWLEVEIPRPNFITISPRGHAHYVWLLDDKRSGTIWPVKQPNAIRYADAIQQALARAVGGDLTYAWQSNPTHNPRHSRYVTREIHSQAYRLDELAAGLDLTTPRKPRWNASHDDILLEIGVRNEGIFRRLLRDSGRVMQRCRDAEAYQEAMTISADEHNKNCDVPLDLKEVATILRSVLKYRSYRKRDRGAEVKAIRHAEGRSWEARVQATQARKARALEMRADGMTIVEIASKLKVTTRTIDRYLSGQEMQNKTTIIAIPIQGEACAGGVHKEIEIGNKGQIYNLSARRNRRVAQITVEGEIEEPLSHAIRSLSQAIRIGLNCLRVRAVWRGGLWTG